MSDYATPMMDKEDDGDIYLRVSLSKYPFLKNKKHGDSGSVSFKGEIENSENNKDGEAEHRIVFSDLSNSPKNVRV